MSILANVVCLSFTLVACPDLAYRYILFSLHSLKNLANLKKSGYFPEKSHSPALENLKFQPHWAWVPGSQLLARTE